MKYKHTHMAFVKALNKLLAKQLFVVQDAQELDDLKSIIDLALAFLWMGDRLNYMEIQMTGMKLKDMIGLKKVPLVN